MAHLDRELRYQFVNAAYARWFGRSPAELEGRPLRDVVTAQDYERYLGRLQAALAGEEIAFETDIDDASGRPRTVRATFRPDRGEDGLTHGLIVWFEDVSARREAEVGRAGIVQERDELLEKLRREAEELARREAFLRLVTDAVPGFLWATRPDGKLLWASRTFEEYVGPGVDPYVSGWAGVLHPDERDAVRRTVRAGLAAGTPLELEYRLRRHDGEYRSFLARSSPERDADGRIRYWVGFALDVTERRAMDAQLRHAEQLQMVGTLAGGVAHEVSNQMTVVLGFGQLALRRLSPGHAAAHYVEQICGSARRAADVTGQLLAYSRRQVLQPTVLDLHEVVAAFVPVLARVLGADKEVVLRFVAGPLRVVVDRGQLERALVNLAANARDAMPGPGTLTLATENVSDSGEAFAALTVGDDGVGMTPEVRARIFEPFFTTKPVGAGTGLGLSTVYGIVAQSGGRVEVDSAPGTGTRVRILLPAAEPTAVEAAPAVPAPARRRSGLVLVVEDELALRGLMATVLREVGFNVRVATDGRDALRLVDALDGPPVLLLADLVMPRHNGREVAARLRERWPVPVLYLSGYPGEEAVRRGLLDADMPFLQKPFTPQDLLDAVDRVLGG